MSPSVAKYSRILHWVASALGLASLLFFSVTGITLNHPEWFSSRNSSALSELQLSESWQTSFRQADELVRLDLLMKIVKENWGLGLPRNIDQDDFEWVLDYQRPGGLTTIVLELETGTLSMEKVDDGLVALINDLHKGRHAGGVWRYLIDITALICIFFSVTGIVLLYVHAKRRPSTWPLVVIGTLLPLIIYWSFVP